MLIQKYGEKDRFFGRCIINTPILKAIFTNLLIYYRDPAIQNIIRLVKLFIYWFYKYKTNKDIIFYIHLYIYKYRDMRKGN